MKRGQAWGLDVTVAFIIFVAGMIALYLYIVNYKASEGESLNELKYEAASVGNTFLSEGVPIDWNASTVTQAGVLSDGKINETKLARLYALSIADYNNTKQRLTTSVNYFINFSEQMDISGSPVIGIGQLPSSTSEQTYRIARFASYKNKPVTVNIIIWKT